MLTATPASHTRTTNTIEIDGPQLEHGSKAKAADVISLTDQTNLLPLKKVIAVFCGLSLCILVSTLDSTIVATALPTISDAFNAGSVVSWVPSAYLLTSTAFQPLYGRFSDIFGRKASLCLAMLLFMLGSILAGFSRSIVQLIIFRGIAGAGGGAIVSVGQIVISDVVTLRDRGKYQGIIGVVVAFGFAIGPLIGGALAQKVNWRWCFWVTPPISFVAMCAVLLVLPLKPVEGNLRRKLMVVDYLGAGLTLAGCTLLLLPLIWGGVTFPWTSAVVLAPLFSSFLVVSLFCFWEWKGARLPIVPMYIFKHVTVTGVYITMFVNGMIFYSALFYLPQFFQVALGYSPIRSGVFLFPVLVSQTTASFIAGQLVSRTGRYRTIIHTGFSVWAIGCGCLSTIDSTTPKGLLIFFMLLSGLGAGQTLQTTTVAAQASVSRKDMSVVTAVRNFARLLGGTLSLALGATIINNSLRTSMNNLGLSESAIKAIIDDPTVLGDRLSSASSSKLTSLGISDGMAITILDGYTRGFRTLFIMNACLAATATLASIFMIRHKELTRGDEVRLQAEARADEKAAEKMDVVPVGQGQDVEMGVLCSNDTDRKEPVNRA
ncbi:major facilitator superfamily domain-containing protein [Rhodofomes roseus]|uniref:Major facilitator superfamily domain-containing protein n=1 Tax=Rhodofomes roseus TaxID=34475 RepID=A0ABQ8K875_9APHY|nr:major facilitator superfamily domain-containing protein [Rhodofomes roseus]KAH9833497.1 major facilitator superfamily domain-containing protein [Rhodofomes roseus]